MGGGYFGMIVAGVQAVRWARRGDDGAAPLHLASDVGAYMLASVAFEFMEVAVVVLVYLISASGVPWIAVFRNMSLLGLYSFPYFCQALDWVERQVCRGLGLDALGWAWALAAHWLAGDRQYQYWW